MRRETFNSSLSDVLSKEERGKDYLVEKAERSAGFFFIHNERGMKHNFCSFLFFFSFTPE